MPRGRPRRKIQSNLPGGTLDQQIREENQLNQLAKEVAETDSKTGDVESEDSQQLLEKVASHDADSGRKELIGIDSADEILEGNGKLPERVNTSNFPSLLGEDSADELPSGGGFQPMLDPIPEIKSTAQQERELIPVEKEPEIESISQSGQSRPKRCQIGTKRKIAATDRPEMDQKSSQPPTKQSQSAETKPSESKKARTNEPIDDAEGHTKLRRQNAFRIKRR